MKQNGVQPNSGSKPLSYDARDHAFAHHRLFGAAPLSALPAQGLGRIPLAIKNQGFSQFCTAGGTSSASEYQEGVVFSLEFQAAIIGYLTGEPILNGADPRAALKAICAYGSLPQALTPYRLNVQDDSAPAYMQAEPDTFIADWRNWDLKTLLATAQKYQKAAYLPITGPYDTFDSIRAALFSGTDENQVAIAFGKWFENWNEVSDDGIVPTGCNQLIGYHCWLFIDWVTINGKLYLVAQNSYGKSFGKGGLQFFDRETVNEAFKSQGLFSNDGLGLFILRDVSPATIEAQKNTLRYILADLFMRLLNLLRSTPTAPSPVPAPTPVPAPEQPPAPPQPQPVTHPDGYAAGSLDDRARMCHLAATICDDLRLPKFLKEDLLQTIAGESGFNQWCVNNTTKDYGLCQFSARYYLKEYNMTPQDALTMPTKCLRIMAKNFRAGRQTNWVAYATRAKHAPMVAMLRAHYLAMPVTNP
jgi:hypothetical protein